MKMPILKFSAKSAGTSQAPPEPFEPPKTPEEFKEMLREQFKADGIDVPDEVLNQIMLRMSLLSTGPGFMNPVAQALENPEAPILRMDRPPLEHSPELAALADMEWIPGDDDDEFEDDDYEFEDEF